MLLIFCEVRFYNLTQSGQLREVGISNTVLLLWDCRMGRAASLVGLGMKLEGCFGFSSWTSVKFYFLRKEGNIFGNTSCTNKLSGSLMRTYNVWRSLTTTTQNKIQTYSLSSPNLSSISSQKMTLHRLLSRCRSLPASVFPSASASPSEQSP